MKLIIAILRDEDSEPVSQALVDAGIRVTRVASTGGFLRRGSTTLLIGLDEERIEEAIQVVREHCITPLDPTTKRATLFVLNVDNYIQV